MFARTILTTSLVGLCIIGGGMALKPTAHTGQDPVPNPTLSHTGQDPAPERALGSAAITTTRLITGLARPVQVVAAPNDFERIFIVEQRSGSTGRIRIFNLDSGTLNATAFLSLSVSTSSEQGLLGLAFHPNYAQNGYFYVNYTASNGDTYIQRYSVSSDPDVADSGSGYTILTIDQPYANHNGGWLGFGPDGYLYIIFGDGGSAGDPLGHGQNLSTLLGSLIRIDIDNPSNGLNYGIPTDNPFIAHSSARDEIYAYGLRNMWRFNWDSETGFLWGADVGQNAYEEIDIIYSGLNYGWNVMEGNHCYPTGSNCNAEGFEPPVWEYELYVNGVCSITGGFVYRGNTVLSLIGKYVYGDWCTGDMWALTYSEDGNHINEHLLVSGINITSFGLDEHNELLFCGNESIYKLISNDGDLNNDGEINVLDVVSIINLILDNSFQSNADLNNDNSIDVLDVVLLINIILRIN